MKKMFFVLFCLHTQMSVALDIDEKLTLRFLKVSNSKKTVLINRGSEDGLAVGDHAKFYQTTGVIARGMVEKVSPSRSIWSVYRIIVADEIVDNKVLNLKIASPVKVTSDNTKSLKADAKPIVDEDAPSKKGDEIAAGLSEDDKKDLEDLGVAKKDEIKESKDKSNKVAKDEKEEDKDAPQFLIKSSRLLELFGTMAFNMQSGTASGSSLPVTSNNSAITTTSNDVSVGIERHLLDFSWAKKVSLFANLTMRTLSAGDTANTSTDWFLYGVGARYYVYHKANALQMPIMFLSGSLGTGTATLKNKTSSSKGKNNYIALGIGGKYNFTDRLGIRAHLEYLMNKETYNFSDGTTLARSLNGPIIQIGGTWAF